jgi:hypothetical protein
MSLGTYWRLALLLPVAGPFLLVGIVSGLLSLAFPPDPGEGPGDALRELAVDGIKSGLWPAYGLWCACFLWWTRRFDGARLKRAMWLAPATFAPLAPMVWMVFEMARGRSRNVEDYALGLVFYLVASLVAGYSAVVAARLLERIGVAAGLVRRPAPAQTVH